MPELSTPPTPVKEIFFDSRRIAYERVLSHLHREVERLSPGVKLPPVRLLARQLGVSGAMVHAAYRQLQEDGLIVSSVGRGTFVSPQARASGSSLTPIRLAISLSVSESSTGEWGNRMVTSLLDASTQWPGNRYTILPMGRQNESMEKIAHTLLDRIDEADSLILFPIADPPHFEKVRQAYEAAGKPVIAINPPTPIATENFVSVDYYTFGVRLGEIWKKTGRQRPLFIGVRPKEQTASLIQRRAGFHAALGEDSDTLRTIYANTASRHEGYFGIKSLLATGFRPDAVLAFGDFLALGALEALREHGMKVPDEVSLVGGTGMRVARELGISTSQNPYAAIGEAALAMLDWRLAHHNAPAPGRYIPMGFDGAATTREVENAAWTFNDFPSTQPIP